jgi:hypothetical protein
MKLSTMAGSVTLACALFLASACQSTNSANQASQDAAQSGLGGVSASEPATDVLLNYPIDQCSVLSTAELSDAVFGRFVTKTVMTSSGRDGCEYFVGGLPDLPGGAGNISVSVVCDSRGVNLEKFKEMIRSHSIPADGVVPGALQGTPNGRPDESLTVILKDCVIITRGIDELPGSGARLMAAFYAKITS